MPMYVSYYILYLEKENCTNYRHQKANQGVKNDQNYFNCVEVIQISHLRALLPLMPNDHAALYQ